MNHTRHLVGWHRFRHEKSNPCIMTLRRQSSKELLITRGPENPFPQTSSLILPNRSPNGSDQTGRPILACHVWEQLFDHLLKQIKLRTTPSPRKKRWADFGSVHKCTIHMVQHIMKHPEINSHHCYKTHQILNTPQIPRKLYCFNSLISQ